MERKSMRKLLILALLLGVQFMPTAANAWWLVWRGGW
jgi:hypothetical protein